MENTQSILKYIQEHQQATPKELIKALSLSERTVNYHLAILLKQNQILKSGNKRGVVYYIPEGGINPQSSIIPPVPKQKPEKPAAKPIIENADILPFWLRWVLWLNIEPGKIRATYERIHQFLWPDFYNGWAEYQGFRLAPARGRLIFMRLWWFVCDSAVWLIALLCEYVRHVGARHAVPVQGRAEAGPAQAGGPMALVRIWRLALILGLMLLSGIMGYHMHHIPSHETELAFQLQQAQAELARSHQETGYWQTKHEEAIASMKANQENIFQLNRAIEYLQADIRKGQEELTQTQMHNNGLNERINALQQEARQIERLTHQKDIQLARKEEQVKRLQGKSDALHKELAEKNKIIEEELE